MVTFDCGQREAPAQRTSCARKGKQPGNGYMNENGKEEKVNNNLGQIKIRSTSSSET